MYNNFRIMRMRVLRNSIMLDCYDCINEINFEIKFIDSVYDMSHYRDLIEKYKNYQLLRINFDINELICNFSERKINVIT